MKDEKYIFTDDKGKIYRLSFDKMMQATDGFYTLPSGKILRRVREFDESLTAKKKEKQKLRTEIVSDSMGFPKSQLPEMREHLERTKVKGVEFVQDKTEPTFYQVKCDSPQVLNRYMKARGFADYNSRNGSGAMLTEKDFENAAELLLRKK